MRTGFVFQTHPSSPGADHGFSGKYWSVNRFVKSLGANHAAAFRRMEVEPGEELQVDFGTGAKKRDLDKQKRTQVVPSLTAKMLVLVAALAPLLGCHLQHGPIKNL